MSSASRLLLSTAPANLLTRWCEYRIPLAPRCRLRMMWPGSYCARACLMAQIQLWEGRCDPLVAALWMALLPRDEHVLLQLQLRELLKFAMNVMLSRPPCVYVGDAQHPPFV